MARQVRKATLVVLFLIAVLAAAANAQTSPASLPGGNLMSPAATDDAGAKSATALRTNIRPADAALRSWLVASPSLQTRPASRASLKSRRNLKPAVVWVP